MRSFFIVIALLCLGACADESPSKSEMGDRATDVQVENIIYYVDDIKSQQSTLLQEAGMTVCERGAPHACSRIVTLEVKP